jgi:steroid 5-alpha reductase family enzyme
MLISGLLHSLLVVLINTIIFYIVVLITKNLRLIDVYWIVSILLITYFTLFEFDLYYIRPILTATMISIWFIIHLSKIIMLNASLEPSEAYTQLQKEWPHRFYIRLFTNIFLTHAALLYVIAVPIIIINTTSGRYLQELDTLAMITYIIGISLIIHGSITLYMKLKVHRAIDRIVTVAFINRELYLGEILVWLAIFKIGFAAPYGTLSTISPIALIFTVYFFPKIYKPLRFISWRATNT